MPDYIFDDKSAEGRLNVPTESAEAENGPATGTTDAGDAAGNGTPSDPSPSQVYVEKPTYTYPVLNGETVPKKKKKKKSSAPVIAVVCILCIVFSAVAGYLGASWALSHAGGAPEGGNPPAATPGSTVIYRSVESVSDSTGNPNTVSGVAAAVSDSVVEITTEETVSTGFYRYISSGAGSGVIISEDGYIVTCNHVIQSSTGKGYVSTVTVTLSNGTQYTATIVGADSDSDIAVLKIEASGLHSAVIGQSSSLAVGETIVAVGNPLGLLGGTVTAGIVSAKERQVTVENTAMTLIQVDAAINPGNSGGGLFNMNGALVGIVNAKYADAEVEGLGFAIPIDKALEVIESLMEFGYVRGKIFVGISVVTCESADEAYYYFGRRTAGLYIDSATEGYNDDVLQHGDRIIAVNGQEITSTADLLAIIQASSIGDVLEFTVSRVTDGKSSIVTVQVTCYEYVPAGISAKDS